MQDSEQLKPETIAEFVARDAPRLVSALNQSKVEHLKGPIICIRTFTVADFKAVYPKILEMAQQITKGYYVITAKFVLLEEGEGGNVWRDFGRIVFDAVKLEAHAATS